MIHFVRGTLVHKEPTLAVVDVQGVGYGLHTSLTTYGQLPAAGEQVRLFTYMYVREDRLDLFGFAEEGERSVFELLIGVSGIGPNSAQTILSGMSVADLQAAIFHGRLAELTSIKGIGKKTAERMLIELKDKIGTADLGAATAAVDGAVSGAVEEGVLALTALGFTAAAARQAVNKAVKKHGADMNVQQLIKRALQER